MTKRGDPASSKQRAALEAGRKAREQMLAKDTTTAGERWAMLLDGRLTVQELTDAEIKKGGVKGRGGSMSRRKMPSHLVKAFSDERLRRAREGIARVLPTAIEEARRILEDPEAKDADKIKVMAMVWDRNLGKNPEHVRVSVDSPWDTALGEVLVDRDLADLAGEGIDLPADG